VSERQREAERERQSKVPDLQGSGILNKTNIHRGGGRGNKIQSQQTHQIAREEATTGEEKSLNRARPHVDNQTVEVGEEHGKKSNNNVSKGQDVVEEIVVDQSCESFRGEQLDNRSEEGGREM
jgi:hypothetical protein